MAGEQRPAGTSWQAPARVAARLTTPSVYLAVLGGLQVALLWRLAPVYGPWLLIATGIGWLAVLSVVLLIRGHWRLKLAGVASLALLSSVAPTVAGMVQRTRIGVTSEHDGLLQIESAVDRLLHGQAIYGVDWSQTPMASLPWGLPGGNPALHHFAYYPLTVLVGVPFRALSDAVGLPFDYRAVLIGFVLLALAAVLTLPIRPEGRFMIVCAIFVNPLITLYLWSGRNDIEFLACVLVSAALMARGRTTWAGFALGIAVALKPFAWVAVPFFLVVLYLRWQRSRSPREPIVALGLLAVVPIVTILPFVVANPGAFWTDVVLYVGGGIPDPYPIGGYGFAGLLYGIGLIGSRSESFSFGLFQLAAVIPALWLTMRAFASRPTLERWMAGYAIVLLAFTFFARFFNDNYVGVVICLLLCVRPLTGRSLASLAAPQTQPVAA